MSSIGSLAEIGAIKNRNNELILAEQKSHLEVEQRISEVARLKEELSRYDRM